MQDTCIPVREKPESTLFGFEKWSNSLLFSLCFPPELLLLFFILKAVFLVYNEN